MKIRMEALKKGNCRFNLLLTWDSWRLWWRMNWTTLEVHHSQTKVIILILMSINLSTSAILEQKFSSTLFRGSKLTARLHMQLLKSRNKRRKNIQRLLSSFMKEGHRLMKMCESRYVTWAMDAGLTSTLPKGFKQDSIVAQKLCLESTMTLRLTCGASLAWSLN
jgi:hypothetical protein